VQKKVMELAFRFRSRPYEKHFGEIVNSVILQDSVEFRTAFCGCKCFKHQSASFTEEQKLKTYEELFCSELCAAMWQELGWMDDVLLANRYLPKDWTTDPNANVKDHIINEKCKFHPEVQIVFMGHRRAKLALQAARKERDQYLALEAKKEKEKKEAIEARERSLKETREADDAKWAYEKELREAVDAAREADEAQQQADEALQAGDIEKYEQRRKIADEAKKKAVVEQREADEAECVMAKEMREAEEWAAIKRKEEEEYELAKKEADEAKSRTEAHELMLSMAFENAECENAGMKMNVFGRKADADLDSIRHEEDVVMRGPSFTEMDEEMELKLSELKRSELDKQSAGSLDSASRLDHAKRV